MNIFINIFVRVFLFLMPKETHADIIKGWTTEMNKENRTFFNACGICLILLVAFITVPVIVAMITSLKLFYWVAEGGGVITFVWVVARMLPLSIKGILSQQKQE